MKKPSRHSRAVGTNRTVQMETSIAARAKARHVQIAETLVVAKGATPAANLAFPAKLPCSMKTMQ